MLLNLIFLQMFKLYNNAASIKCESHSLLHIMTMSIRKCQTSLPLHPSLLLTGQVCDVRVHHFLLVWTPGLIRENRPELTSSATGTRREDGARILRMCLSSDMSLRRHLWGSDWSSWPNTVLWLADLDHSLICIGSQYRQSVIRTDHHPRSVTLGLNMNKAKANVW